MQNKINKDMDKNEKQNIMDDDAVIMDVTPDEETADEAEMAEVEGKSELEALKDLLNEKEEALAKEKKEYLFLMAEFDNFRKRTVRERADLLKNAAESALKGLLPIVDDFERALEATKESSDAESAREGMNLIYNKLIKYLEQNGVKAMDSTGSDFDDNLHEAIAMVPTGDEAQKGKVIDTVSKGYMLNDKVLRHAKVAVGQ